MVHGLVWGLSGRVGHGSQGTFIGPVPRDPRRRRPAGRPWLSAGAKLGPLHGSAGGSGPAAFAVNPVWSPRFAGLMVSAAHIFSPFNECAHGEVVDMVVASARVSVDGG